MEHLMNSGVTVVQLSDALDLLEQPVREPYVCVTFDDGYLDNLEHGLPILEELEIPATIFVIGDVLEGKIGFPWYDSRSSSRDHRGGHPSAPGRRRRRRAGALPHPPEAHDALRRRAARGRWPGRRSRSSVICRTRSRASAIPPASTTGVRSRPCSRPASGPAWRPGPASNPGGSGLGELRRTMIAWRDTDVDFEAKLSGALDRPSWLATQVHARRTHGLTGRAAMRRPA